MRYDRGSAGTASLAGYLPQDRLRVLAAGQDLPDRMLGAALFADISGFTPLTEQLTQQLGARRGTEELARRVNRVYDALIGEIERYGGSVISFAGDAMTCWFDDSRASPEGMVSNCQLAPQSSSARAVAAAFAVQTAMQGFPGLGVKVAVASGPVRRFAVGDPAIQRLDTLAGATLTRLVAAEHLARTGEVVVDAPTFAALDNAAQNVEWRTDAAERFAVLQALGQPVAPAPLPPPAHALGPDELRPWVLRSVYEREQSGLGAFLTELRPAIPLFMSFGGLDYDGDEEAGPKLDAVIRRVQTTVARYSGALLQLTIGDKGNYLYANFGAVMAHEDDARRAVQAALELHSLTEEFGFLAGLRIGVTSGTLRVGAYGGTARRMYGALGDDVNLAARLMTAAAPGEVLVSGRVHNAAAEAFTFEPRPPLAMKGKAEPLPVFAVTGRRHRRATRLQEPAYRLPMIGRQPELALIADKLRLARQGKGQVIGITAEAGMGKSRLVAEAIRLAQGQGYVGYGGACESSGTNTAYLVWKPIWQAFFDSDPAAPLRRQLRNLEGEIEDRAPHRLEALPVLGTLLDLPIEDNDFTRTLEPKDRRNVLIATLEDCLKAAAQEEPLLFVLEDVHWIDPLSHDLLESLARVSAGLPVCFILAYRPFEPARLQDPRVESLPHFSKLTLPELTLHSAEQLIRVKLAQLFPERGGGLPRALVGQLTAKAQGNPFFLEELLNYLRDRGLNPDDAQALSVLELPNSLHTLVLSRMDQLTETQKVTLKVASIIGRLFPFAWLHGYYPALGAPAAVKADLSELARLELTALDTPEPELAYLFKHIVTQEAAYESLSYATRAQLHEQLAQFLETRVAALGRTPLLDVLAFHYSRSENRPKQREYLRKAGEAAQAAYANAAAQDYYERLLPLLGNGAEQTEIRLKLAAVLELLGRWAEAETQCRQALAQMGGDAARTAACQFELGKLSRLRGDYAAALTWLAQARAQWAICHDPAGQGQALLEIGIVYENRTEYAAARQHLQEGQMLARAAGDRQGTAKALNYLGNVAYAEAEYATAAALYEESLALKHEIGDKEGMAISLNNLGLVARVQGEHAKARALHEACLALCREIGAKKMMGNSLSNLGNVAYDLGDYAAAQALIEESLLLFREMRDKRDICYYVASLGHVVAARGDFAAAQACYEESLALCREIGDKRQVMNCLVALASIAAGRGGNMARAAQMVGAADAALTAKRVNLDSAERRVYARAVATAKAALGEEAFEAAFAAGQQMTLDEAVAYASGEAT